MDNNFKKKFLKGSAAATIGTVASMGFHFLSIMFLTRYLNKQEFGVYTLIIVITALFNVLSGLGLDITVVKYISAESTGKQKGALTPILVMRGLQLLFICLLFLFFGHFVLGLFDPKLMDFQYTISILFVLTSIRDLFFNILQGLNYFRKFASVQISSAALRILLILIFLKTGILSIDTLIYIEIATTALSVFIQLFHIPFKKMIFKGEEKTTMKEILKFSFPLYLNVLLTFTYDRVSVIIIGAYLTPVSVAFFDVANKIPEALKRIFQSFMIVFFPNISQLFAEGRKEEAVEFMNKSMMIISSGLTIITAASFIFRNEIVRLLFSKAYMEVSWAFALLMLAFYLRAISNILGYTLVSAGFPKGPVKVNIFASIISVGASIVLVPLIGFMGSVIAGIAMNSTTQILYTYHLNKEHLAPTKKYLKPLFILSALVLFIYFAGITGLVMRIMLFAVVSAAVFFVADEGKKYLRFFFRYVPGFRQFL